MCGKTVTNFARHLKIHAEETGEGEYRCSLCGEVLSTKKALRKHKRSLHKGAIKPIKRKRKTDKRPGDGATFDKRPGDGATFDASLKDVEKVPKNHEFHSLNERKKDHPVAMDTREMDFSDLF